MEEFRSVSQKVSDTTFRKHVKRKFQKTKCAVQLGQNAEPSSRRSARSSASDCWVGTVNTFGFGNVVRCASPQNSPTRSVFVD